MQLLFIASVAVLGTALWLWLLRRYDKIEPESVRHLLQVMVLGGGCSMVVAAFLNSVVTAVIGVDLFDARLGEVPLGLLALVSLIIGFNEEVCKAVAGVLVTRRWGNFDEPIDAMIYAMSVGLGFGALESVLYALRFGTDVLVIRFLWPVPAHMAYAAIWGYGLAKARYTYPMRSTASVMAGPVVLAALAHAGANFLLLLRNPFMVVFSLAVLFALALLAHYRLHDLVAASPFLNPGECHACRHSNPPKAHECERCGAKLKKANRIQ